MNFSTGGGGGATVAVSVARNTSNNIGSDAHHHPTSYGDWRGGSAADRLNPDLFNRIPDGGGGGIQEEDGEGQDAGRGRSLATGVSGGQWGVVRVPRSDCLSSDFDLLARGSGNFTGGSLAASGVVASHESPFADAAVMVLPCFLFSLPQLLWVVRVCFLRSCKCLCIVSVFQ